MRKRKVFFVITKGNWGGAQRYVYDVVTNLPKNEFDALVAFGQPGRLAEKLRQAGIRTVSITSLQRDLSPVVDVWSLFELCRLFKKERPDIVHLNSSKAGGLGALAARLTGVPKIIFTSHGLAWEEDRNPVSKALIYAASRLTFLLCHTTITISESTHRRVSSSVLVYNGVSSVQFLPRAEARRILGLPQEGLAVGAIGELTHNKGYRYLLDAIALVHAPAAYVIVGDGEERAQLEQRAAQASLPVRFVGFVPEAARLLSAFDVFVMSSVKEGLPYVLLEAGQAGLPVVGSDIAGIADIVDGAGILVPAKNPATLAKALKRLLGDAVLRQALGEKLQERVRKEFSLERMMRKTIEIYRS